MGLLHSFPMYEAIDFIIYLEDQEMDEKRYQQYLQTDMSISFEDFKSVQKYTSMRKKTKQPEFTAEDEKASLDFANSFIHPKRKETETE